MDRLGNELLAGAAFAGDEDRDLRFQDLLNLVMLNQMLQLPEQISTVVGLVEQLLIIL